MQGITTFNTSESEIRRRASIVRQREQEKAAVAQRKASAVVTTPANSADECERIAELVSLYVEKWPWIVYTKGGSRAQKAGEYVLDGLVHHSGGDDWLVKGHRCSLERGFCDCEDRIRFDKTDGKLCAHRLAAMILANWHGKRCARLVELIEQLDGYDYIDLYVERDYAYHGHGERVAVAGYLLPGHQYPVHWMAGNRFEVTLVQFQWVMEQTGYALVRLPEKLGDASHYYYRIAKGEGLPIIRQSFHFRGTTEAMRNREAMRKISAIELAVTLDMITGNPAIVSNFSQYEARRIWQAKEAIDKYGLQAVKIDELPAYVVNLVMFYLREKKQVQQ